MANILLTCPHCGQSASYQDSSVGNAAVTGTSGFYCKLCKKGFELHLTRGVIDSIKKK